MNQIIEKTQLIEYLKTPAGCDGGNIAGNNWLFSIEYGGEANLEDYENLVIDHEHRCVPDHKVEQFINAYTFNQRIAKFEAVKHGWDIEKYTEFAIRVRMFTKSSEYYKGNIGGLQFKHDDNASFEKVSTLLGISSKERLKKIEVSARAEMFQKWVKDYSPNCICCFGTTDSKRFFKAFSDIEEKAENWRKFEGFYYYHHIMNGGKTNLFILPHPTARSGKGLTSDKRIKAYGAMVRVTMVKNGFQVI